MKSIQEKISSAFLYLLMAGIGAVLLVSVTAVILLNHSGRKTTHEMNDKAIENCRDVLTDMTGSQMEEYVKCFGSSIDNRFLQTTRSMKLVAEEIKHIYKDGRSWPPAACPNGKELKGSEKAMHWLLPEGIAPEGAIREEIGFLGNAEQIFRSFSQEDVSVLRVYFTSVTGINVGYDGDYEKKPAFFEGRDTDWYRQAAEKKETVVQEVYADSFLKKQVVTFSMPCLNEEGDLLGVLAADLSIEDIEAVINRTDLVFDGYVMLVSAEGSMIAAEGLTQDNLEDMSGFLGSGSEKLTEDMKKNVSGMQKSRIRGKNKYVFYSRMETGNWDVVVVVDSRTIRGMAENRLSELIDITTDAAKASRRLLGVTCLVWLSVTGAVLVFIFRYSKRMAFCISEPVVRLCREVKRVGSGDLSYTPDIHTGDEIEELGNCFAEMTASLSRYVRDVKLLTADQERLSTELNVATQIQASMLPCIFPAFPERQELDIYASMTPAREVGGDFYDFYLMDEDHLCMVMADVSGKGVPAALFMVIAKTLLKDNMLSGRPPAEVFQRVNNLLFENNDAGMFVTAFLGVLTISNGEFRYVNAGHNPPAVVRADGKLSWLVEPAGFVLAGMQDMQYQEGKAELSKGDLILAYTDGVTEAMDRNGCLYTDERLKSLLGREEVLRLPAEGLVCLIKEQLKDFAQGAAQADDITLLALRYLGDHVMEERLEMEADLSGLNRVQEFIAQKTAAAGCGRKTGNTAQIAAEEIFTNIAKFAYGGKPGWFLLSSRAGEKEISFIFEDEGVPFNPLMQEEPSLDAPAEERPVGGLGIWLVKKYADRLSYTRKNGRNILVYTIFTDPEDAEYVSGR